MRFLATENGKLAAVVNDGSTFEEGIAIGRIQLLMELLSGKVDAPEPFAPLKPRSNNGVIGNGAQQESAATKQN